MGQGPVPAILRELYGLINGILQLKKPLAQYAYQIDPVAYAPIIPSAFNLNGISDILSVGEPRTPQED